MAVVFSHASVLPGCRQRSRGDDTEGIRGIPMRHVKRGCVLGGYSPSPLLYRAQRWKTLSAFGRHGGSCCVALT